MITDSPKQYESFKKNLLPILRCPSCGSSSLELATIAHDYNISISLCPEEIICSSCQASYPVTDDYIPIMWTNGIKEYLQSELNPSSSVLGANMSVYDSISDDYNTYSRRNVEINNRINNAVRKVIGNDLSAGKLHLDFGCGPGHVIGWLEDFGFTQFGLDVSLSNLRNAKRQTNALVVCGDASNMPFVDGCFDIVTESSALHHINDWKATLTESCRVCSSKGGIVIDSEPSQDSLNWSWLAVAVMNMRFPIYKAIGHLFPKSRFYWFRDSEQAKLNLLAEIHHQPGTGFPVTEVERIFESSGFRCDIVVSPSSELLPKATPPIQHIILHALSLHNPWDTKYGSFVALAKK
jgi:ubiquinone/menaquinone biosynthesis C-methylase UbiE/uncharacterized protein YbaR (Trm112 family)